MKKMDDKKAKESADKETEDSLISSGFMPPFIIFIINLKSAGLIVAVILSLIGYYLWYPPAKNKNVKIFTRVIYILLVIFSLLTAFFYNIFEDRLKGKYGVLEYHENQEEIWENELAIFSGLTTRRDIEILNSINFEKIEIEKQVNRSAECENRNGEYYENICYGFSIIFPKGWKISRGNELHNLIKAENNDSQIIINTVKFIGEESDKLKLLEQELTISDLFENPKSMFKEIQKHSNLNFVLLESQEVEIFGRKAFFIKTHSKQIPNSIFKRFTLYKNGIIYSIRFSHPNTDIDTKEIIEKSISKFNLYNKEKYNLYNN